LFTLGLPGLWNWEATSGIYTIDKKILQAYKPVSVLQCEH
jgi:hypothetical protein